ncbi:hypothetical protein PAEVO_24620 [Paenibacillus sp. GM2FR]|nr:hypothetical protein PAEVO_24620 [Paenibacillus sp. GM2FR]
MNKYDDGWTYLDKRNISFFFEIRKHSYQSLTLLSLQEKNLRYIRSVFLESMSLDGFVVFFTK